MRSRAPRRSWTQLPELQAPPDTVLEWLAQRFPRISLESWQSRLARGLVLGPGGRPLDAASRFAPGLRIAYFREVEEEPAALESIRIVVADDHLVVADKPPFLPVVPAGRFVRHCLLYRVEEQLGATGLTPIHRLDRFTSGLVLLARHASEVGAYGALFAKRRIERRYDALACGAERRPGQTWAVTSRIVRGEPFFRMQEVDGPPNSRTGVELCDWREGTGRFVLRPATGKKHQLRLHMASLGWPILGDRLYPHLQPEIADEEAAPLALVAKSLTFVDPVSGTEHALESAFEIDRL